MGKGTIRRKHVKLGKCNKHFRQKICAGSNYYRSFTFTSLKAFTSQMQSNKGRGTSSINSETRTMKIVEIRHTVGYYTRSAASLNI